MTDAQRTRLNESRRRQYAAKRDKAGKAYTPKKYTPPSLVKQEAQEEVLTNLDIVANILGMVERNDNEQVDNIQRD